MTPNLSGSKIFPTLNVKSSPNYFDILYWNPDRSFPPYFLVQYKYAFSDGFHRKFFIPYSCSNSGLSIS